MRVSLPRKRRFWLPDSYGRRVMSMDDQRFDILVEQLSAAGADTRRDARDELMAAAIDHMRSIAHRMIRGFPKVRRWDETDDVVQGASLRLVRALDKIVPTDPRHLLGLVAVQVRRELLDLARRYGSAESFARHHETNVAFINGQQVLQTDHASDPLSVSAGDVDSWSEFHAAAGALGEEEQELFNLIWYLGLSRDQVARTLSCSVRTVARRWDIVKRHLLDRLKGQAPT
jgi:RNA polymerase sigma factor (sigma-70 family)